MIMDANMVILAELKGMRRLARLDRPKIHVRQEDVPGASCIWNQRPQGGGHRDLVRLCPGSNVRLADTLRAIRASRHRPPGGHLEIRGAAGDLDREVGFLTELGGREVLTLPRALMARRVGGATDEAASLGAGLTVTVADSAEALAELRIVVAQSFAGATEEEARNADVEADFFHAPGVMTYLAVHDQDDAVISTGSIARRLVRCRGAIPLRIAGCRRCGERVECGHRSVGARPRGSHCNHAGCLQRGAETRRRICRPAND
nr:hypothetical protein [Microlunatus elymi]